MNNTSLDLNYYRTSKCLFICLRNSFLSVKAEIMWVPKARTQYRKTNNLWWENWWQKRYLLSKQNGQFEMKGSKAILKGHFVQFKKILKFNLADELENVKKTLNERVKKKTCCSVAKSCLTICDPIDCSASGFPVLHYLPEFAQTHTHWVSDAIQPSHPLLPLFSSCPLSFPASGSFLMTLHIRWSKYWSFSWSQPTKRRGKRWHSS